MLWPKEDRIPFLRKVAWQLILKTQRKMTKTWGLVLKNQRRKSGRLMNDSL